MSKRAWPPDGPDPRPRIGLDSDDLAAGMRVAESSDAMRLSVWFVTLTIPVVARADPSPPPPWIEATAQFPRLPPAPAVPDAEEEEAEPAPPVAAPEVEVTTRPPIKTARDYTERYVREIGGHAGFLIAPELYSVTIAPSFGWFIADHVQLSTLLSLTSIKSGADTSTIVTATLEPSYHLRIDPKTYLFGGFGFGYSYIRDQGSGLTYTLRVGAQFLFRGDNLFIPSISYDFRTNENDDMESVAAAASQRALRINLGYAMMF